MKKINPSFFFILHLALLLSSLSGVASKMAARYPFLSLRFLFFYGLVLVIMFVYAIIWQQILKKIPLTIAHANKAVSLVWGMVWGSLLFHETITWKMILGSAVMFFGIYLVVTGDE